MTYSKLVERTVNGIMPQDQIWRQKARRRLELLTMPHWALGRLMDLAEDLAGMTRSMHPPVKRRVVVTMAGDHGVTEEGVSKYPSEVTGQMMHNFASGGAGINALTRASDTDVVVVDMGVAADLSELAAAGLIFSKRIKSGTGNIAEGPAMSRRDAIKAVEAGIDIALNLNDSYDLFGTGDMGIGNTTPSAAIVAAFTGCSPAEVTGRGTGIDDAALAHKREIIGRALDTNKPDPSDGLDVLSKVGGFEIGGIAGLILGAAHQKKPVLIDGFISTAGALIARSLAPHAADYMIGAHRSAEPGHRIMQQHLGLDPLLDLGLRLGEGTGAAVAMNLVDASVSILTEISTFKEASVSEADK